MQPPLAKTIERLPPVYNLILLSVKSYPISFLEKRTTLTAPGLEPRAFNRELYPKVGDGLM